MPRSVKLPFVPGTLKQVREITGCSKEEAARRVRKDVETIRRWESEKVSDLPSLAQAKILAKLYRFSAGVFLLDELPSFIRLPDIKDFRTVSGGQPIDRSRWSRNLRYLMRQMESRQVFVVEVVRRSESNYQPWVGSIDRSEISPEELAAEMRELLKVRSNDPRAGSSIDGVLRRWIHRFEQMAGVFVFQTDNTKMPIEVAEMRGLSIGDRHAPFIVLNSKDSHAGRIFTLFHEFAHLWIGSPGISASFGLNFRSQVNYNQQVERFCDSVAANALMPREEFLDVWQTVKFDDEIDKVKSAARKLKVSRHAVAVRAFNLNVLTLETFSELRQGFAMPEIWSQRQSSGQRGNYYATLRRNAGNKYIDLVLREYYSDEISIKETAALLDARIPSVFTLAEFVGFKP